MRFIIGQTAPKILAARTKSMDNLRETLESLENASTEDVPCSNPKCVHYLSGHGEEGCHFCPCTVTSLILKVKPLGPE